MEKKVTKTTRQVSRRDFIKASAAISAAVIASPGSRIFAAGSDKVRVGLVGCGARGTGAAKNYVQSAEGVELVAMADVFQDRLDKSLAKLKAEAADKVSVTTDTCFIGFDAYRKLIASGVDVVILATPPGFRPEHLRAAVEAGKHVFMEKPAAVDPVGIRSIIASSELAKEKGLSIVAGTQQRRMSQYIEIMKRVHTGQIGEIVGGQCYWNWGSQDWHFELRKPEWSDMEWQIRCWPYFTWLSGDHIVEQHVHNLDIINWAIGSHPVQCLGMGGRQVRTGPEYGNIFDHFAVEYEYPGGVRVLSMCSQINGTTSRVCERVVGTKGSSYTTRSVGYIEGQNAYKYDGPRVGGMVEEHADLIKSIRDGKPVNEGRHVAESTMTAIMGRISAYTGRALKWDWVMNASKLDLTPPKYEMGDLPVGPVAIPGKTQLI
ncbi:MAG TPA: Gfo/Idh/MocA family oxidoreductase [Sedimentisphaerales bacterium]|nr:Gfo/Idh/MocA family oxidoreductase [Sedimentisphaerales bacterium]